MFASENLGWEWMKLLEIFRNFDGKCFSSLPANPSAKTNDQSKVATNNINNWFMFFLLYHQTSYTLTVQLLGIVHLYPMKMNIQVYIKQQQADSVTTDTHSHSNGGTKAGLVNLILQLQNVCLLAILMCQSWDFRINGMGIYKFTRNLLCKPTLPGSVPWGSTACMSLAEETKWWWGARGEQEWTCATICAWGMFVLWAWAGCSHAQMLANWSRPLVSKMFLVSFFNVSIKLMALDGSCRSSIIHVLTVPLEAHAGDNHIFFCTADN